MKICPVCGDATFDDQSICFGCLHRYEDEYEVKSEKTSSICPFLRPATFRVSFEPADGGADTIAWSCTLNLERA